MLSHSLFTNGLLVVIVISLAIISVLARLSSSTQLCNASYYVLHKNCQYNCTKQVASPRNLLCADDGISVIECNGASCFHGKCEIYECTPNEKQLPETCWDRPLAEVTSLCTEIPHEEKRTWTNLLILPIVLLPALLLICLIVRQLRPHIQRHPSTENETTWAPLKTSSSQQFEFPINGTTAPNEQFIHNNKAIPQIRVVAPSLEDCRFLEDKDG